MLRSILLTIVTLLTTTLVAACGDSHDHDHDHGVDAAPGADAAPRQVVMDTRTLGAGEIIEATLTGGPADRADLHLTATVAELDWNIHGHVGGGTQTVAEELNVTVADYAFTPSAQGEWFVLLRNSSTAPIDITVRIELYGAIAWSGWP